jgi:hypothetical protein
MIEPAMWAAALAAAVADFPYRDVRYLLGTSDVCNCNYADYVNDETDCFPDDATCTPNDDGGDGCCDTYPDSTTSNALSVTCVATCCAPPPDVSALHGHVTRAAAMLCSRDAAYRTRSNEKRPDAASSSGYLPPPHPCLLAICGRCESMLQGSNRLQRGLNYVSYLASSTPDATITYAAFDGGHNQSAMMFSDTLQSWAFAT